MPPSLRRLFPALLAAVLAALALGIVACGEDSGGSADAQKIVKETFSGDKTVDSGVLNLSLEADLEGSGPGAAQFEDPVTIRVSGPFQSRGDDELPALDLEVSASSGGQTFSAGAITTGEKGYLSYQGTDYVVPEKTFADFKKGFEREQRQQKGEKQQDLSRFGVEPEKWLENPKVEGDETIGGAETTHVSADVSVPALLADVNDLLKRADDLGLDAAQRQQLPGRLDAKTRKQLEKAVEKARVDIYSGKDDRTLRRLEVELEFDVPSDLTDQLQGLESGRLELTLEVAKLNEKQTIEAPKKARPLKELEQQIGLAGLGGAALGEGGSGGSSGRSGSSTEGGSKGSGGGGGASSNELGDYSADDVRRGKESVDKLKDLGPSGNSKLDSKRAEKYLECAQKAKSVEDLRKCGDALE